MPFFTSRARPHDITETTRGNLFMQDRDGFWCTPPLDEQVLPGVTRREVLDLLDDQRTPARIRRCSVQESAPVTRRLLDQQPQRCGSDHCRRWHCAA